LTEQNVKNKKLDHRVFYTSRVLFKGHVTMDEMVFNLKHHCSIVTCEELELYGVS